MIRCELPKAFIGIAGLRAIYDYELHLRGLALRIGFRLPWEVLP
jgi:hypothetical protein